MADWGTAILVDPPVTAINTYTISGSVTHGTATLVDPPVTLVADYRLAGTASGPPVQTTGQIWPAGRPRSS